MASRITPTLSAPTSEATTDRRQDILNAALACAVDGGVDAVSIDGVRARCGASVGSIYHHFGNKDGIVAALFFDIFHDQSRSVQAQLDAARGVEAGVRALVTGYLDWVVAQPERARFLFQARSAVAAGLPSSGSLRPPGKLIWPAWSRRWSVRRVSSTLRPWSRCTSGTSTAAALSPPAVSRSSTGVSHSGAKATMTARMCSRSMML